MSAAECKADHFARPDVILLMTQRRPVLTERAIQKSGGSIRVKSYRDINTQEHDMHKFHSIAAPPGDGLRSELRALFERLAFDPHSGLRIRHDGMTQAGPDPDSETPGVVEAKPKRVA